MVLEFDYGEYESYSSFESIYNNLLEVTFKKLSIKTNYEVDVSFVDEETIHSINREYRGVDRVTDVISFAFNDDKSEISIIKDDDTPRMLGEILICIPRALEQAKEYGNSDRREISFLFVHGLLHLLGYDHMKKEDEEIMFPLQEEIMIEAGEPSALRK